MRIIAIYRHYWPDSTPYARLLKSILESAAADGHEVTAYAAQPSYNDIRGARRPAREEVGGVQIRRVRLLPERKRFHALRAVNEVWFILRAMMHVLLRRRYSVIIANSRPPILTGCALWLLHALTGTPYILHLQDIHPEGLQAVGRIRSGVVYRVLRRMDAAVCRRAWRCVTLSHDMAEVLRERGLDMRRVAVVNNSPLPVADETPGALPASFERTKGTPILLFAGNLGEFQGLDVLVDAARVLADGRRFRLIFLGEGAAKDRLKARAGGRLNQSIFFEPYVTPGTAVHAMVASDFGIVSLAPGVYRCAYPSKLMTYLGAGCPVLALMEPQSEISRTIVQHRLGIASTGISLGEIVNALRAACAVAVDADLERQRQVAERCEPLFGEKRMLRAWRDLLAEFEDASATAETPITTRDAARAAA